MEDFIFLNVRDLIERFPYDEEEHRASCKTHIDFFRDNGLLRPEAPCLATAFEKAVIRYSDFTDEGQRFIMTAATDKWLASCDRKKDLSSYADSSGLERRLKTFRQASKP